MAAAPARARADYDYLIKLLLIGDSGAYYSLKCVLCILFLIFMPIDAKRVIVNCNASFCLVLAAFDAKSFAFRSLLSEHLLGEYW